MRAESVCRVSPSGPSKGRALPARGSFERGALLVARVIAAVDQVQLGVLVRHSDLPCDHVVIRGPGEVPENDFGEPPWGQLSSATGSGLEVGVAYTRLSRDERLQIEALWRAGFSMADIADQLGRARSTITRELRRNGLYRFAYGAINPVSRLMAPADRGLYARSYCAAGAHERTRLRAVRGGNGRLVGASLLRTEVCERLRERWSPRQISQRLRLDFPEQPEMQVSHETIYQALYLQGRGNLRAELADQVALRSGRKRRQRRPDAAGAVRSARAWTTDLHISTRPAEAADRAVPGHWEGDLVIGARGASAIITCVERSTRYVLLGALPDNRSSAAVIPVLSDLISRLPEQLRRSLTWDNGSELAQHAMFSVATGCPVYFCDPHSPWQRGSNENTNGLLRQYFPRSSTDFRTWTQHDLDGVARQLNGRPRETLGWRTPAEALNAHLVALAA